MGSVTAVDTAHHGQNNNNNSSEQRVICCVRSRHVQPLRLSCPPSQPPAHPLQALARALDPYARRTWTAPWSTNGSGGIVVVAGYATACACSVLLAQRLDSCRQSPGNRDLQCRSWSGDGADGLNKDKKCKMQKCKSTVVCNCSRHPPGMDPCLDPELPPCTAQFLPPLPLPSPFSPGPEAFHPMPQQTASP